MAATPLRLSKPTPKNKIISYFENLKLIFDSYLRSPEGFIELKTRLLTPSLSALSTIFTYNFLVAIFLALKSLSDISKVSTA